MAERRRGGWAEEWGGQRTVGTSKGADVIKPSAVGGDEEMKTRATPQPPRGNAVTASQIPRNILTAPPPTLPQNI